MNLHKVVRMKQELKRIESQRKIERLELAALEREVIREFRNCSNNKDKAKLVKMKQKIDSSALAGEEHDTQIWYIRKRLAKIR